MEYKPYYSYIVYQITEPTLKACYTTFKNSKDSTGIVGISSYLADKLKKIHVTSNKTEFNAFGIKFIPKDFNDKILFYAEDKFNDCFSGNVLKDIKPKTSYYELFKKLIKSIDKSYIYDYDDEELTDYVYSKNKGAEDCG